MNNERNAQLNKDTKNKNEKLKKSKKNSESVNLREGSDVKSSEKKDEEIKGSNIGAKSKKCTRWCIDSPGNAREPIEPKDTHRGSLFSIIGIPLLIAIISGLVVAVCSPSIQDRHNETKQIRIQKESLEKISLGMHKGHIDELFGYPLFMNDVKEDYTVDAGGDFCSAAYKLHKKSLLCLYRNESLVAYVVMTKERNQYTFQPYSLGNIRTFTLSDFTYAEFGGMEEFKGYYPIIGSYHIQYYYEVSGGYHGNNLEYDILGTYRNYMDDSDDVLALLSISHQLTFADPSSDNYDSEKMEEYEKELMELRKKIHPDVYGVSKYKDFNFVRDVIRTDDQSLLLTADD